jgi:hypothetical protein
MVDCSFLSLKLSFPSASQFKEIKGAFKNGHNWMQQLHFLEKSLKLKPKQLNSKISIFILII